MNTFLIWPSFKNVCLKVWLFPYLFFFMTLSTLFCVESHGKNNCLFSYRTLFPTQTDCFFSADCFCIYHKLMLDSSPMVYIKHVKFASHGPYASFIWLCYEFDMLGLHDLWSFWCNTYSPSQKSYSRSLTWAQKLWFFPQSCHLDVSLYTEKQRETYDLESILENIQI